MDAKTINLPDLVDATNHEQIFNSLRPKLAELCPIQPDLQYYICISSGTPAMHACWLMLAASGEIHAVLLHKPDERMLLPRQAPIREINPYTRFFPLICGLVESMIFKKRFCRNPSAAKVICGKKAGIRRNNT